jgi:hypothetical protein
VRRRAWIALIAGVLVVTALAVGGWLAVTGAQARADLQSAATEIAAAQKSLLASDTAAAQQAIERAAGDTEAARSTTSDPVWRVVGAIPLLGNTVKTVTVTALAADQLTTQALPPLVNAVDELQPDKVKAGSGALKLGRVTEAAAQLELSSDALAAVQATLDSAPTALLLGPVAEARGTLATKSADVRGAVDTGARVLRVLPTLLGADRPRTYFAAFQSPAEIRGTGGFLGTFAIMTVADGKVKVDQVGTNAELVNFPAPIVDLGPDYAQLYGISPGRWVNMNLSPNFPYAGVQWATAWKLQTGRAVDGVLGLDVTALQYLVEATGPVTTPDGRTLTAADVVPYFTRDIYADFGDENTQRKQFQATIASDLLTRALSLDGDPGSLVKALTRSVSGRNLQLWSAEPEAQAALLATPLAGATDVTTDPYLQLVLNNGAGNKMDSYVARTVRYTGGACQPGGRDRLSTVEITLANTLPATGGNFPIYVTEGKSVTSRTNRTIVYVHLSQGSGVTSATLGGKPVNLSYGSELGHPVAYTVLELPPGGTPVTLRLNLQEPASTVTPKVPVQPMVLPQRTVIEYPPCN